VMMRRRSEFQKYSLANGQLVQQNSLVYFLMAVSSVGCHSLSSMVTYNYFTSMLKRVEIVHSFGGRDGSDFDFLVRPSPVRKFI
jgi:hypothetical protein